MEIPWAPSGLSLLMWIKELQRFYEQNLPSGFCILNESLGKDFLHSVDKHRHCIFVIYLAYPELQYMVTKKGREKVLWKWKIFKFEIHSFPLPVSEGSLTSRRAGCVSCPLCNSMWQTSSLPATLNGSNMILWRGTWTRGTEPFV